MLSWTLNKVMHILGVSSTVGKTLRFTPQLILYIRATYIARKRQVFLLNEISPSYNWRYLSFCQIEEKADGCFFFVKQISSSFILVVYCVEVKPCVATLAAKFQVFPSGCPAKWVRVVHAGQCCLNFKEEKLPKAPLL